MTFDKAWRQFESIQYGFTRDEALALWTLTKMADYCGKVVEVGSMQGGSASIIEAAGRDVLCIDPIENPVYYQMFLHNTKGTSIKHLRFKDSDIWPAWADGPIAMLHIDHDHSYETTIASLLGWRRHMTPGGLVLVHDYDDPHWVDVKPAVTKSGLNVLGVVGRLAWGRW